MEQVQAEMGRDQCRDLKPRFSDPRYRCYPTVEKIAQILDRMTEEDNETPAGA